MPWPERLQVEFPQKSHCSWYRKWGKLNNYGNGVRSGTTTGGRSYPGNDPKYRDLNEKELPLAESLKDTLNRVLPYWLETIVPVLKSGKRAIISAHGNSLRVLVKYLDNISDDDVLKLNIPTGISLVYELDENLKPIKSYYLADPEEVRKAMEAVASQGKAR